MSKKRLLLLASLLCGFLLSGTAVARRLFLNNVPIDGLKNRTFTNVTVTIDEKGNVYIAGKQYIVRVEKREPPPTPVYVPPSEPSTPPPTRQDTRTPETLEMATLNKYVLVVQRTEAQGSGYSLVIWVNGREARKVSLYAEQDVFEITHLLRKGSNRIEIEATKEKKSTEAPGMLHLFVTKGEIKDGRVLIKKPYVMEYKRSAFETENYRHTHQISLE